MNISYNYPTLVNNNKPRMSQIFKTNSRFDALIADVDIDNKPTVSNRTEPEKNTDARFNSFKRDDRPRYEDRRNNFYDTKKDAERKSKEDQKRKEMEIERKTKETEEALSANNFPDMGFTNKVKNMKESNVSSFADKIKEQMIKNVVEDVVETVEEYISPGYVVISKDITTNKCIFKFGEQILPLYYEENRYSDNIFELYEKRTNTYIEMWGEFEYTKVFKFPNYDYDYFDRLDQQYEEEVERQFEKRRELDNLSYISSDEY